MAGTGVRDAVAEGLEEEAGGGVVVVLEVEADLEAVEGCRNDFTLEAPTMDRAGICDMFRALVGLHMRWEAARSGVKVRDAIVWCWEVNLVLVCNWKQI